MANSTADTPDVSETKLARMRVKDLREHARERGIQGADDLHKPELLALVKDWHYVQEHGEHRPDAAGRAGRAAGIGVKKGGAEGKKAESRKKAESKKSASASSGKSSGKKKATDGGSGKKKGGNADVRRAVADVRRRLGKVESALDDLESTLS